MKLVAILVGIMISIAQVEGKSAMQMPAAAPNQSLQPIEQPLPIKIGVVVGGIILISTEFWWFLGRK